MSNKINIIQGPPTSKVTKEAAEKQLVSHPQFPKDASYTLDEVEGRWVAAITVEAGPPAFADDGAEPEAPAPELSEGPPSDDEGPSDDGPELPGDDDSKSDDKGDDEKGEKGELKHIEKLLTTLLDALGINPDGDSPVPGPDDEQGPPAPDGPPSPDGPPGGQEKQVVRHERSLKPGESAPGTTPIGAPSFASVADDHPWKGVLGKKRSFPVEEEIGNATLASVRAELNSLAAGTGYEVKQLREGTSPDGKRTAKALIAQ